MFNSVAATGASGKAACGRFTPAAGSPPFESWSLGRAAACPTHLVYWVETNQVAGMRQPLGLTCRSVMLRMMG